MFWKNRDRAHGEEVDGVGRLLVRAASLSDDEADRAVSSPFLYARLRARIEAEEKQPNQWVAMLLIARRAMPVLLIIAVSVAGVFWLTSKPATPAIPGDVRPAGVSIYSGRAPAIGACAISTAEECAISKNEVLATIFAEDGQGGPR